LPVRAFKAVGELQFLYNVPKLFVWWRWKPINRLHQFGGQWFWVMPWTSCTSSDRKSKIGNHLECQLSRDSNCGFGSFYGAKHKIRFVNSGTEAVYECRKISSMDQKDKIIKFAGCYHGHSDSFDSGRKWRDYFASNSPE
jgi:hypothetical protein